MAVRSPEGVCLSWKEDLRIWIENDLIKHETIVRIPDAFPMWLVEEVANEYKNVGWEVEMISLPAGVIMMKLKFPEQKPT